MEVRLTPIAAQQAADQRLVLAELARGRRRRCCRVGTVIGSVQRRRLHQDRLRHQIDLLGSHHQILQGPHQVVLEAADAAGDRVGLAAEAAGHLLLQLLTPPFQRGDLPFQGGAPLLQLAQGQIQQGLADRFGRQARGACWSCRRDRARRVRSAQPSVDQAGGVGIARLQTIRWCGDVAGSGRIRVGAELRIGHGVGGDASGASRCCSCWRRVLASNSTGNR